MPAATPPSSLSPRSLLTAFASLAVLTAILHALCLHFYPKAELDIYDLSDYWPMSVFKLRLPKGWDLAWAALLCAFYFRMSRRWSMNSKFWGLWTAALAIVTLSSLTQGYVWGLDTPTAGWGEGGIEYYHDARAIQGPLWFLRHFHELQPVLMVHAITHPPGPILLYWALDKIFLHPTAISVAVAALALLLSLSAWRRLLDLAGLDPRRKAYFTLLFAALPGIQIYYLAVMDAVFAGVISWALVAFLDEERPQSLWVCGLALTAASLLSFGYLFIFPVYAGLFWLRKKGLGRLAAVCGVMVLVWLLLWLGTGYNYLKSFAVASKLENEGGFLLLANPRGYLWYRIGAALEIAIYFTPFLILQLAPGLRAAARRSPLVGQLFWLGLGSVAAMLLSGAMKIGEAARICLFLIPYLLLPVALRLDLKEVEEAARLRLLDAVFGMGLAMQLLGFYQW